MKTIHINDIQPVGNFKELLEKFRERADGAIEYAHEIKNYHEGLSKGIKTIVGEFAIIDVLEEGIETGEGWNIDEMMICLLYTHLIIVDLNQTAHTYLNKITEWDSPAKQVNDLMENKPHIYKGLKIIE